MEYDKTLPDGTKQKAVPSTYKVLDGTKVIFDIAQWIIVIAAFEFAYAKFGFMLAKITSVALSLILALYIGVLISNLWWKLIKDPFHPKSMDIFSRFILPGLSASVTLFLLHLMRSMVVAH